MLPRIWEGETVFILGGGFSLSLVNFDLIKHRKIIGVNNAYGDPIYKDKRSPDADGWFALANYYIPRDWVDILWFGDGRWFNKHRIYIKKFKGLIAHCAPRIAQKNLPGVIAYKRKRQYGIVTDPDGIAFNKSSGASAINFAYHLGVKRIILLGFDMKRVNKIPNWHSDHPAEATKEPYDAFLRAFPHIKKDLDKLGVEVINCTEGSAVQQFEIMKLEDYLKWEKKGKKGKRE